MPGFFYNLNNRTILLTRQKSGVSHAMRVFQNSIYVTKQFFQNEEGSQSVINPNMKIDGSEMSVVFKGHDGFVEHLECTLPCE